MSGMPLPRTWSKAEMRSVATKRSSFFVERVDVADLAASGKGEGAEVGLEKSFVHLDDGISFGADVLRIQ